MPPPRPGPVLGSQIRAGHSRDLRRFGHMAPDHRHGSLRRVGSEGFRILNRKSRYLPHERCARIVTFAGSISGRCHPKAPPRIPRINISSQIGHLHEHRNVAWRLLDFRWNACSGKETCRETDIRSRPVDIPDPDLLDPVPLRVPGEESHPSVSEPLGAPPRSPRPRSRSRNASSRFSWNIRFSGSPRTASRY